MLEMSFGVDEVKIKCLTCQIEMNVKNMIDTTAVHVTCIRDVHGLIPGKNQFF
jgi:hypothetical protein